MANFNIPSQSPTNIVNLTGFLGVDFTSSITEIDKRRSPSGYNFINKNGAIEKRNGYKSLAYLGNRANINGIWNVDTLNGEYFIIHCGTKLYKMKTNFSSYEEIMQGLADKISKGVIIQNKLLILDGKRAIVFNLLDSTTRYLDEIGYIPTTQIARSPNGTASQMYEQVNLLQDKRINQFTSTEADKTYQLADTNIQEITLVEVMDNNGEYQTKVKNNDYTVDLVKGQVNFIIPVGKPVVDGRDNVRITYKKVVDGAKSQVNKCDIMQVYGYAGANNRVFISGNANFPNIVMYTELDDITYIPVENVIKCGLEVSSINGLIKRTDGKLAVLKPVTDTDSTIFYIGYGIFNGNEVFPIEGSQKGEGNIGKYANDILVNEPLILTNNGVFALNTANFTNEKYVYHRSYYIDNKLKYENNLKDAVGIVNDGKYYLAINNNVYVADSRFKSSNSNSSYSNYQYEWYYWTNLPVRVWFVWNNELYFGDKYGNICKFRDNNDENRFLDENKPVESEWNSAILDLNYPAYKKNIKRLSISSNPTDSELIVGYRLKAGDKQVINKIYQNSTYPKTTIIRKKAKKLSFFSIYIESNNNTNMCFNSICVVYTTGSYYKGD